MKYLFYFFFFITSTSFGQLTLKSNKFSFRELKDSTWTEFSNWEECNVRVVCNGDPKNIEIFDDPKQTYTILEENDETKTEKGERVISYNCEDSDCSRCNIIFIEKSLTEIYLIVYYSNLNLLYNVIEN